MAPNSYALHNMPDTVADSSASSTAHNVQTGNRSPVVGTTELTNSSARHAVAGPDNSPPPDPCQPPKLPAFTYFLRSVGLKVIASTQYTRKLGVKREEKKPVIITSRRLALAKAGVHLVPCLITVFLIGFNAGGFVNGPEISIVSRYFLQIASKLHELTIVGMVL